MEMVKIKNLAESIKTGKTPPTKEEKYFNGDFNWYTPGDLDSKRFLGASSRKITLLAIHDKKAIQHKKGTLLIGCIGNIGKLGITVDNCSSNQQITGIFPNSNTDVNYLYYWFRGNKKVLELHSNNAVVPILNNRTLENIKIPLPPLAEQKRIAAILDKADQLRQLNQQVLDEYDALTQSLFLDMFGDPVVNPMGWSLYELGDFIKIKHGFAFKSAFFAAKGKYILLTPGNFYEKGGYKNQGSKQKYYTGNIPREYLLKKDDLLIAMTEQAAGLLGSALFIPSNGNYLHNQRLGLVINIKKINTVFLFYIFNNPSIRKIIHFQATGTKVRHTSPTKIQGISVGVPPIPLQEKFAKRIQQIESQKAKAQAALKASEDLFNALLQKAFKGEL